MITLYKLISEKELLGIGVTLFKEFTSGCPLHFYTAAIPTQNPDQRVFLVKCEIEENTISNFKIVDGELIVEPDKIAFFNTLIADKIKVTDFLGNTKEIEKETLEILKKEEKFFKTRLNIFLETNDRTIISSGYLNSPVDPVDLDASEEDLEQKLERFAEEQKILTKRAKEKTSVINSVEDAVGFLINEELDEDQIREIKNQSIVSQFNRMNQHFGFGMYLRNLFIYPNENKIFLEHLNHYKDHYVRHRGEHGEGIISDLLWRTLNDCRTTPENQQKILEIEEKMNVFRDEFYSKKDTTHLSEDEIFEVWDEYRDLFNKSSLRGFSASHGTAFI